MKKGPRRGIGLLLVIIGAGVMVQGQSSGLANATEQATYYGLAAATIVAGIWLIFRRTDVERT